MRNQILLGTLIFLVLFISFEINYAQPNTDQNNQEMAERFKALGIKFYKDTKYKRAIEALNKARKIRIQDFQIYFYLGLTYHKLNKFDDAITAFNFAHFNNPQCCEAFYNLGLIYINKDIKDEAIRYFIRALEIKPEFVDARFQLAKNYWDKRECSNVIDHLRILIKHDPNKKEAHYYLGLAYNFNGEKENAIQSFNSAINIDPTFSDAYFYLGEIHFEHSKFLKAIGFYEKAKKIGSKRKQRIIEQIKDAKGKKVASLCKMAYEMYYKNNKLETSLVYLNSALKILPESQLASGLREKALSRIKHRDYYDKAERFLSEKKYADAIGCFEHAVKFAVQEQEIQRAIEGRKKAQRKATDKEVEKKVQHVLNESEDALKTKNYEEAIEKLIIASYINPGREDIRKRLKEVTIQQYLVLGNEEKMKKNWEEAGKNYKKILEIDSTNADAKKAIKELEFARGELNKALIFRSKYLPFSGTFAAFLLIFLGFFSYRGINKRILKRRRFNPYICGSPILQDDLFIDREDLIDRITSSIHGNSFMIKGERRSGKTSLLHKLKKRIQEVNESEKKYFFIPFFVDLEGVSEQELFSVLARSLIKEITNQELLSRSLDLEVYSKANQEYLVEDLILDVAKIIKQINLRFDGSKAPILVFMIDEIDIMNKFDESTKSNLRSIFQDPSAENLKIIATASHIEEWSGPTSDWTNFFSEHELGPFSDEDARKLIEKPVAGLFNYEEEAIEKIMAYTNNQPFTIQRYCEFIITRAYAEKKKKIIVEDVEYVHHDISRKEKNE